MRFGFWTLALPCFDTEGGGGAGSPAGGGNTGAPSPASTSGTPAGTPAPSATPGTPGGTAQPGSGTPSGGGSQGFTYKEDRSNWVPSHVLRERMEKERAERARIERDLEFHRRQVAALTGVKPQPIPNPEHDAIKEQFLAVFPQFKGLLEGDLMEKIQKIAGFDIEALQRANQETQERVWATHGTRAVQTFESKVKELYGDDVGPKQMRRILSAFAAEAQDDAEMTRRYELGDFSVIDEFLADWSKGFIDPIRKSATQPTPGQVAARRLPRAGGGSAVVGPKPPTVKPSDGDKFHGAAFAAFQNSRS